MSEIGKPITWSEAHRIAAEVAEEHEAARAGAREAEETKYAEASGWITRRMGMADYGEPWRVAVSGGVFDRDGGLVLISLALDTDEERQRIVECVNACQGVAFADPKPGQVAEIVLLLRSAARVINPGGPESGCECMECVFLRQIAKALNGVTLEGEGGQA